MVTIMIDTTKEDATHQWEQWKINNPLLYSKKRKKCSGCGTTEQLQIHHKDGDKRNNNLPNLECLCKDCHWMVHTMDMKITYITLPIETPNSIPFYKRRWWQKSGWKKFTAQ